MASPHTDQWWANFLDLHGRDSEEEAGFLGYLTTQAIPAFAGVDELQRAYEGFRVFVDESRARDSADPGPSAEDLAAQQARLAIAQVAVPRSRVSDPLVQKPLFAATRPPAFRRSDVEAPVPQFAEGTPMPTPQPIPGTPPRGAGVPGPQPPTAPPGPGEPPSGETPPPSEQAPDEASGSSERSSGQRRR
jgi:hypothetical protein